ncbi:hypothetical protein ACLE20_01360 [Rhizobium sp. YIM 134829]|uniref:hypothetical protein n=1 Tax=Rhizobium sp. YIM 134829 TaxID=3390453 RepID=UPI00397B14CE
MSALTIPLLPRRAATRLRVPPVNDGLARSGVLLLLLILPFALLMIADPRQVHGLSVWLKPIKFALSLGVHLLTAAVFWSFLGERLRGSWRGRLMAISLLVPALFEITYIAAQAAAGQDSHFNLTTAYTRTMFALMGVFAVILTLGTSAVGVAILRADTKTSLRNDSARLSIGVGFALSGLLGLLTGAAISLNGGHLVGMPQDPRHVVALFGWSREVGDLRISHFIGLHAAQALPLLGWLANRIAPQRAWALVSAGAAVLTLATLAAMALAFMGRPFIP